MDPYEVSLNVKRKTSTNRSLQQRDYGYQETRHPMLKKMLKYKSSTQ